MGIGRRGQRLDAAVGELDPAVAVVGEPQVALVVPIPLARQKLAQQGVQRGLRGGLPGASGLRRNRLPRNRSRFPAAATPPLAGAGIGTGRNFGRHFEAPHATGEGGCCPRAPMPPKSRQ